MNKRHYEHTLPNIRGSLSNTYDKCFGDAGLNTVGNQRQTAFTPVREPLPTQGKTDSPLITGSLGLFTASSPPADEEPNLNLRKKKKKKKQLNL